MKTVKIPIAMQNTNSPIIIKSSFYFIFYHIYYIFYNFNPNPRGCNYVHEISDSLFRFLIPVALRLRSWESPFLLIYHTIWNNAEIFIRKSTLQMHHFNPNDFLSLISVSAYIFNYLFRNCLMIAVPITIYCIPRFSGNIYVLPPPNVF